jgi:hypothetical protein
MTLILFQYKSGLFKSHSEVFCNEKICLTSQESQSRLRVPDWTLNSLQCYSYNTNNIYLLQMGCHPVAVIILHVFITLYALELKILQEYELSLSAESRYNIENYSSRHGINKYNSLLKLLSLEMKMSRNVKGINGDH